MQEHIHELKLEFIFKRESKCKSLEGLQHGHVAENEKALSGEESKQATGQPPARDISMTQNKQNTTQVLIANTMGKDFRCISKVFETAALITDLEA